MSMKQFNDSDKLCMYKHKYAQLKTIIDAMGTTLENLEHNFGLLTWCGPIKEFEILSGQLDAIYGISSDKKTLFQILGEQERAKMEKNMENVLSPGCKAKMDMEKNKITGSRGLTAKLQYYDDFEFMKYAKDIVEQVADPMMPAKATYTPIDDKKDGDSDE